MSKALFYIAIFLLAGCGTTAEITSAWADQSLKYKDLDGVLVIAVANQESARIDFESAYAKALQDRGVNAVASYTLVPGKAANEKTLVAAAKKAGLETILVSHYAGTIEEPVYHQGTTYYDVLPGGYGGGYHGGFGGYYGQVVKVGSTADIWTMNKFVVLVSDLYETETEKPIWNATSRSMNPDNRSQLRDAFIKAFVDQMEQQGLLN